LTDPHLCVNVMKLGPLHVLQKTEKCCLWTTCMAKKSRLQWFTAYFSHSEWGGIVGVHNCNSKYQCKTCQTKNIKPNLQIE